ncbi:tRNA (cytosine(38)-C(5))-methyltransferase isoform X1 [Platichthys flesus]|uniref:tRNA (cytosine(38)-C(5))-methyltransferase isoform X1 n=1 Tax=Platichthys flesus TaxID=8260 RepID=UPI002DB5E1B7|nr:tRNA (cytosine(38)-C(5))-methyltransferase isoform X1 [Platichthys flesus]
MSAMESLRVLELYSGIGGMHYALKESGIPCQVVAAIDINTATNQIYRHNFPDTPLWNKTIEGIPLEDFNKLSFDMILMSPPCQPFTRIGLQGDIHDLRTKSFLYILDVLPRLHRLPRFILLENVKGFESSSARNILVKTLMECGYTFQEIMVSPTSVGIPNSRLRYFLTANLATNKLSTQTKISDAHLHPSEYDSSELPADLYPTHTSTCQPEEDLQGGHVLYKMETATDVQRKMIQNNNLSVRQIQDFLEPQMEANLENFLLPPKTLLRYALLLDIVQPSSRRSVCFTKGYGRYVEGTGSVLTNCMETEMEHAFTHLDQCAEEEKLMRLMKLKLRYFTPREVANLMGFPQSFCFPEQISTRQQYRALGNSLNVLVVTKLLQTLLS